MWIGTGWTIFNNKGKPIKKYEPFFSNTHDFQFANIVGVSSTIFYDPLGRIICTLYPNHTFEKVVFNGWEQEIWDVNDTVLINDPSKEDPDLKGFFERLPPNDYLKTWYQNRINDENRPQEQSAAQKTQVHAKTFSVKYLDVLGLYISYRNR